MLPVLTIGHSTHASQAFAELLRRHRVEALADVRRNPGSRRVPWTNPREITRTLAVEYVHLAELGGRRRPGPDSPNGFWRNESFRGYADHMAGAEFANGLDRLLALARVKRVTAMCAEALWWRCHRRLLADALVVRGVEVLHVDPRGGIEPHRLNPAAVVDGTRLVYPPEQGEQVELDL